MDHSVHSFLRVFSLMDFKLAQPDPMCKSIPLNKSLYIHIYWSIQIYPFTHIHISIYVNNVNKNHYYVKENQYVHISDWFCYSDRYLTDSAYDEAVDLPPKDIGIHQKWGEHGLEGTSIPLGWDQTDNLEGGSKSSRKQRDHKTSADLLHPPSHSVSTAEKKVRCGMFPRGPFYNPVFSEILDWNGRESWSLLCSPEGTEVAKNELADWEGCHAWR